MGERTFSPIKEILLGMDLLLVNFNGVSFSILIYFFSVKEWVILSSACMFNSHCIFVSQHLAILCF